MIAFPKLLLLRTAFFMLAIGLPALFAPKTFIRIMDKTLKNSDIIRLWAIVCMIFGLLYLSVYRKINEGQMMVFSIFGWLSMLKGLFLLRFPNRAYTKFNKLYSSVAGSIVISIFILLFSAFMIWLGLSLG